MESKTAKKLGDEGFINTNCWLAKNVGHPPTKRCQYCQLKFSNCLFYRYLIISFALIAFLLIASLLIEGKISKLVIISIFILVIVYGRFFDKSTEKIIEANFASTKAKGDLEELTKNLQKKVDEQTKEIREAYEVEKRAHEELKKLDDAKSQFMMITQHHLRTPLSVNMGYLDLLMTNQFGKIPEKIKEVLAKVQDSTLKEIDIVNDLLNVSQFQLGKEVIKLEEKINIRALFKEIAEDLKTEADNKKIYIKIEEQGKIPKISGDKIKLKLALANILDNAVKYTSKGGVDIKIKSDDSTLKIEIEDTGIGIPAEDQKNLFNQTFNRSQKAQKINVVGKGIGLYLSAKIIEAHNGKIWAESEGTGKGSAFHIELPIS
jgi:signal transduction histidine kinase